MHPASRVPNGGDPLRPAGADLAIATVPNGGDLLRPAGADLAIATVPNGGDPLRPAGADLAIATRQSGSLNMPSCDRKDLADPMMSRADY